MKYQYFIYVDGLCQYSNHNKKEMIELAKDIEQQTEWNIVEVTRIPDDNICHIDDVEETIYYKEEK